MSIKNSNTLLSMCLQVSTQYELVLLYGEMNQKCAKGLVFPYDNGLIHSLLLHENHLKVLIDKIDEDFKNLHVSVKIQEVNKLHHAVGTVIQWPRIAIVIIHVHLHFSLPF